ncbi:MAG: alcohol dehydrogenase catalytic domain-containing protein [bacterium]
MKALYLEAPGKVYIKEIEDNPCPSSYAKVKVLAVGICGSDISAYKGTSPLVIYPRIIGHEVVGEIIEIDPSGNFQIGDKVILEPYVYCGTCYPCSIGRTNTCENLKVLGVHIDGGMAEYICHPMELLHKLPEDMPYEELVMVEPLSISLHAIHRLKLKEGEHIVIFGAGQIGNLAAQVSLYLGAIPIIIDLIDSRLEIAKKVGISFILNPQKDNIIQSIKDITDGRMAECVIEATGSSSAIRSTIETSAYTGRIAFVGWPDREVSLPTSMITRKELDVYGSRNSVGEFPEAIELIKNRKVNVEPLISKVVSFDELPEYLECLAKNPGLYLKIIGRV